MAKVEASSADGMKTMVVSPLHNGKSAHVTVSIIGYPYGKNKPALALFVYAPDNVSMLSPVADKGYSIRSS